MMSNKDNSPQNLFIVKKREFAQEDFTALHAVTRQAEQALQVLKAQKYSQCEEAKRVGRMTDYEIQSLQIAKKLST